MIIQSSRIESQHREYFSEETGFRKLNYLFKKVRNERDRMNEILFLFEEDPEGDIVPKRLAKIYSHRPIQSRSLRK